MNESKVITHTINGVKYDIDIRRANGYCDKPKLSKRDHPEILLPRGLLRGDSRGAKLGLRVLLHEILHAADWNKHENTIERVSKEICDLLWLLGYRRK